MEDIEERLEGLIEEINTKQILVIVEGKKDLKALEELGIEKIYPINRKPIYKVIDEINEKEVLILTDLDQTGKELYSVLKSGLQNKGIKINNNLRNFLFKTEIRQIEGITHYILKKQGL
ncbi:MAG: toprim domain-containing protein [Candidatus Nanoarchaeia archaeon]|nr:toprim domain-containing protein [Candidatus Nanoarchaeia archaeon]